MPLDESWRVIPEEEWREIRPDVVTAAEIAPVDAPFTNVPVDAPVEVPADEAGPV